MAAACESGWSERRVDDVKGRMRRETKDGRWFVVMMLDAKRRMSSDARETRA